MTVEGGDTSPCSTHGMALGAFRTTRGTLTFSGRPNDTIFAEVRARGVALWWTLARELPDAVPHMSKASAVVRYLPLRDYHVPEGGIAVAFREHLDEAVAVLRAGRHVHVSCYGGRGRTGLALACITIALEDLAAESALRRAREACRGPETEEQEAFVRAFGSQISRPI